MMATKATGIVEKFQSEKPRLDTAEVVARHPEIQVRDITQEELDFYYEHGWVKLPSLISEETAALLLAEGERFKREEEVLQAPAHADAAMRAWGAPSLRSDLFTAVCYSPTLGNNAARLMSNPLCGPRLALRSYDALNYKRPEKEGGKPTLWHQDFTAYPFDRGGMLVFWIALVPMTPDMGTLRFVEKSHRMGIFGRFNDFPDSDALKRYPGIARHAEFSPPLTMRPGDATVHDCLMLHSAPSNETDRPRWVYQAAYFPNDTLYTGANNIRFDHFNLPLNQPIEHPNFPVVGDLGIDELG